jgi:hypothetical protein
MEGVSMQWRVIDKSSLPTKEVLAANFKRGSYGYKEKIVGYSFCVPAQNCV